MAQNRKKQILYKKQGGLCAYCDQVFAFWSEGTIDHILPKSRGGSNIISNLALVCVSCNMLKGNTSSLEDFDNFAIKKREFLVNIRDRGYLPTNEPLQKQERTYTRPLDLVPRMQSEIRIHELSGDVVEPYEGYVSKVCRAIREAWKKRGRGFDME